MPGADVFVDQTHLRHGHLWQPSLFDAIAKAQAFLILVSRRAGDWQKFEYYEALDRKVKDDAFVLLPVIIADRAKGPAANLPGLAQLHWIESTEPTAPDPLAKIVAALQSREVAKPPEPWRAINPYRGLVALEEQDADFFFGRDREAGEIIDKIIAAPGRLIALVGNSGVGKSSLVQAGVIGSLKRQRWPGRQHAWPETLKDSRAWAYLAMKPGEDPIDALMSEFAALWFPDPTDPKRVDRRQEWAERLRQGKARLADVIKASDDHLRNELSLTPPPRIFLYIDQGEELYARSPPAERKRFSEIIADGLARNPQRLIVMTSQRADYYGELQANAALFGLTEKIDVPPLECGQSRACAARAGARARASASRATISSATSSSRRRISPARCRCSPISSPTCGSACASAVTGRCACRTAARSSRSARHYPGAPTNSLRSPGQGGRREAAVHAASRPRAAPGRAGARALGARRKTWGRS